MALLFRATEAEDLVHGRTLATIGVLPKPGLPTPEYSMGSSEWFGVSTAVEGQLSGPRSPS